MNYKIKCRDTDTGAEPSYITEASDQYEAHEEFVQWISENQMPLEVIDIDAAQETDAGVFSYP